MNNEIFCQRFLKSCARENAHIWYAAWWRLVVSCYREPAFFCLFYLPPKGDILSFFPVFVLYSFLPYFEEWNFIVDFLTNGQASMLIFGIKADDELLYCGIENQPSSDYSSLYLSNFFPSILWRMFFSKMSQQPCKLECLYLVCRLMTSFCIMGLRTSILL